MHVPEILADALGLLLDEVGVVARHDDRALAAGLVGPREADPDGGVEDAVHFFDGVDHLVEGLGGLDAGRGLFAGQQDGHVDEGLDGLGCPVEEAHAQVVGGTTARLEGVLVGRETVAGEDVAPVEEVLRDVSMQVHRGADHRIGADNVADRVDEVALGVVHALNAHGTVDVEEEAVEGTGRSEAFQDLSLPGVVGTAFDDTAGQSSCVQDGDPLDLGGPVLVAPVEAVHQLLTARDDKVVGGRDVGRERRGFDVDTGDRNAGLCHERFSFEILWGVRDDRPQSAASRPERDDSMTRSSMMEGRHDW